MTGKHMLIGMELGNGYGTHPNSWRAPWVDPTNYTNYDARVRYAQAAERGKLQFIFLPDGPAHLTDIEHNSPGFNLDVLLTCAVLARATERIGFVATSSTTFNEPYHIARQFKALDIMSHGRMGWNAVTSNGPEYAANFGQRIPSSEDRYGRAHESIQLVQALWGSWGQDAWVHNQASGQFAKAEQVQQLGLGGKYVATNGPLYIPPSEQGQPVIFQAGMGPNVFGLASQYGNAVVGAAATLEDARKQRAALRQAAEQAGRNPDEVKFLVSFQPTIAPTKKEALARRATLVELPPQLRTLAAMLGLPLSMQDFDQPISAARLAAAPPRLDARSQRALAVAREGWTVQEILAHGVTEFHPATVGTAAEAADHMQRWFEAGAADGFWVAIDVYEDGVNTFVDEVVPLLQARGLFHQDYEGATLREHLGVPVQYGRDPRFVH